MDLHLLGAGSSAAFAPDTSDCPLIETFFSFSDEAVQSIGACKATSATEKLLPWRFNLLLVTVPVTCSDFQDPLRVNSAAAMP